MALGRAAALGLLCLCVTAVSVSAKKEHVKVLVGQTEFEEAIKENPFIVVEFYAPWCGHCKNLAPEWEKAAQTLSEADLDPPIVLANLDATEEDNKPLATKYGVKGFPTIKIFKDGDLKTPLEYNGPREAAGIVSFLKKQAGPAVHSLADASAVKDFVKLDDAKDVVVVGVLPDGDATEEAAEFKAAAQAMRDDFDFGLVTDASLVAEAKGAKSATVLVFKSFDESPVTYDGALTNKDLVKWVKTVGYPPFAILDQSPKNRKVLQKMFEDPKPKLLVVVPKKDAAHDAIKEALVAESKSRREELNFIYVDPTGNDGALEYFGLKQKDAPAYVIHDQSKDAKFISKNVDAGSLSSFLDHFKAGKLKKTIKSEDPPEPNDGPVTILTASNFDDIVQPGKNYMIEFYAPWCGHCKKLTPIYEKVGEAFKDDPTVVVAKMDATANDINDTKKFPVKGFPTLKFLTADGEVLDYSGDRSEEDLIKYIKVHADSKADDPTVRKDEL